MRAFSPPARAAMLALSTPEAFIALVTITHAPTAEVFRVCMNTEAIVSRGNTFAPYAFRFQLPAESGEEVGQVGFEIDNTDLMLVDMLRRITQPAEFLIEIVLASDPDQVELRVADLIMREATWNATTISGKLMLDDVLNQKFPKDVFDPIQYAGLF
jgi:hypothetical protein